MAAFRRHIDKACDKSMKVISRLYHFLSVLRYFIGEIIRGNTLTPLGGILVGIKSMTGVEDANENGGNIS